jgi:hypothetical protein
MIFLIDIKNSLIALEKGCASGGFWCRFVSVALLLRGGLFRDNPGTFSDDQFVVLT